MKNIHKINNNIYITNDEEIKMDDWYLDDTNSVRQAITECESYWTHRKKYQKIILTTDVDLIKDGIQPIDDEFLEWFVKNPSCEEVKIVKIDTFKKTNEVYVDETTGGNYYEIIKHNKIIIPQEESKQETHICKWCKAETWQSDDECYAKPETLEEFIKVELEGYDEIDFSTYERFIKLGAKWQQEQDKNKYSEEEVIAIVEKSRDTGLTAEFLLLTEQFKKK